MLLFSRNRARVLLGALLACVLAVAEPALAGMQYVIVGAEPAAPGFEPGRILDVDDSILIPEGTVVTLLGEDGSVNAIPGPVGITVTEESVETTSDRGTQEEARSAISKIAQLLGGEKKTADSLGVARSIGGKPKPRGLDNPWIVSVHGDDQACVKGETITLGRASAHETIALDVAAWNGDAIHGETWESGESQFVLPSKIPASAGEIEVNAGGKRALIQLNRLPAEINAANPVDVLGWMIASGCKGQALAFTRQLVVEAQ